MQATVADIAGTGLRAIAIGPFGSSLKADLYTSTGFPVIRGQDITNGRCLDESNLVYVPQAVADSLPACVVTRGDLVFPHRGAIGRVGIVGDRSFLLSSSLMKLTCNPAVVVPEFVFYYFRGPGKRELMSRASTVGTPGIGQPLRSLRGIPIAFPGLSEQRTIAEVLSVLDDKIAANTKILGLLLEHLAAEFESLLTASAQSFRLADLTKFHNRNRVPLSGRQREQRPGKIPYYGASGIFGRVDEALFNEHLVLVGEDGSVVTDHGTPVIQYIWGPAWVNNHAHVLTGTPISTELLYFAIARKNVTSLITGAVQPKISMGSLKSLMLDLPPAETLPRLEGLVRGEMELFRTLRREIALLTDTRDLLLPELMSGKIRVKDAEKTVEEVL